MKKNRGSHRTKDTHATEVSSASSQVMAAAQVGSWWQATWDRFWFTPTGNQGVLRTQQAVSAIATVWFLCFMNNSAFWWNETGLSATNLAAPLEAITEGDFVSRFRWSPLWSTDSPWIIGGWCVAGIILAALAAIQMGGQTLRVLLAIWVLLLSQRVSWVSGTTEPFLVALCFYLAIAQFHKPLHWSHGLATRLIQVHLWLLLCAAFGNQLAHQAWWQGETVWWLAANGRSNLLNTEWLGSSLLLVNLLTHLITLSALVAIVGLWPFQFVKPKMRYRIGVIAAVLYGLACILLANQVLYGLLLIAALTCTPREQSARHAGTQDS